MLESTAQRHEAQKPLEIKSDKVTCFVCKKEVDRTTTTQLKHSKERGVWVCQGHVK